MIDPRKMKTPENGYELENFITPENEQEEFDVLEAVEPPLVITIGGEKLKDASNVDVNISIYFKEGN